MSGTRGDVDDASDGKKQEHHTHRNTALKMAC